MKALVYTAPETLAFRDEPAPPPLDGEALVQIDAVGICGSDMHGYLGHDPRRAPPLILGHEACGTVLEGASVGQRVVLNPLVTCGTCTPCLQGRTNLCPHRQLIGMARPGAFAERIRMPERNLLPVPDGLDPVHAALTEPCATSVHALGLADRSLHRPIHEGRALVIGAGSVGLLAALLLRARGCQDVTIAETHPARRASAAAQTGLRGLDPTCETARADHYELVVDAVGGTMTRAAACAAVRAGGTIVHIGLMHDTGGLDVRRLTLAEITLAGCYTYTHLDLAAALQALASGALGDLGWVEQRDLADGPTAFADLAAGAVAAAKVVLRP
jgi:2-desacetyl-2-hydroxyethyl bacteriochlorophyllide A dehydrogenase